MSYYLYITRKLHWSDEGPNITAKEWLGVIADDPELELAGENGEYFTNWLGASTISEPWFNWSDGNIYATFPDKAQIAKVLEIASRLNAKVEGQDGEVYTATGVVRKDAVGE